MKKILSIFILFIIISFQLFCNEITEVVLEETNAYKESQDLNKLEASIEIIPANIVGDSSIADIQLFFETPSNSGVRPFFSTDNEEFDFILQKYNNNSQNNLKSNISKIMNNEIPDININDLVSIPLLYNQNSFKKFKKITDSQAMTLTSEGAFKVLDDLSKDFLYSGPRIFLKSFLEKRLLEDDFFGNFYLERFILDISQRNSLSLTKDGLYLKGFINKDKFLPDFMNEEGSESEIGVIAINLSAFQKKINKDNYFKNNFSNYMNCNNVDFQKINSNDVFNLRFMLDIERAKATNKEGYSYLKAVITTTEGEKISKTYKFVFNKGLSGTIFDDIKDTIFITSAFDSSSRFEFDFSEDTYSGFDIDNDIITSNFSNQNSINISENNYTINKITEEKEINSKNIYISIRKTNFINNLNTYKINIGTVYHYESNINNIVVKCKKREDNTTEWYDIENGELALNINNNNPENYRLIELELDLFIEGYEETPEKTIRVLVVIIKEDLPITPILSSYSPKYFTKVKEEKNESLFVPNVSDPKDTTDYFYYGLPEIYSIDYIKSFYNENGARTFEQFSTPKLQIGKEYKSDAFGNIDTNTINYTNNIKTIKNTDTKYKLGFNSFAEYENRQFSFRKVDLMLISPLIAIRNDFHYNEDGNDTDTMLTEDIFKDSDIDNIINISGTEKDDYITTAYKIIHSFQDIKYSVGIDNSYILNNFKMDFRKNKKVFFQANEKVVPLIALDYNIDNSDKYFSDLSKVSTAREFDNFGEKMENYKSEILEYINDNNSNSEKTRKFFLKNIAILDKDNKYIKFNTTSDSSNALINFNIAFRWNYISVNEEISINHEDLYLKVFPISEYNLVYNEYPEEQKVSIYNNENDIKNYIDINLDNFDNTNITEAHYIRDLYENEVFNPENNNAYEITDNISDNALLINPDFFSRLGDTYTLSPMLTASNILNENSINQFFLVNSNQKIRITFNKNLLFNLDNIEWPGTEFALDSDPRVILSSNNQNLFTYFTTDESFSEFNGYKKIIEIENSIHSGIENFGTKYIYDTIQERDEVVLNNILYDQSFGDYFSNEFIEINKSLNVIENINLYNNYRLSKFISPNDLELPNLLSHIDIINSDFSTPEELYINFNLEGVNATENRIKKVLSCNYSDMVKTVNNLSNLNKYEIKYNIVKLLPNLTNIYQVYDTQVKEIATEYLPGTNIPKSDISPSSMFEWALHGRVYDDSSLYLCSESKSNYYMKLDHFNLDNLNKSYDEIQTLSTNNNIKKYFTDNDFSDYFSSNTIIVPEIQSSYEIATAEQELKSLFLIDTKDEVRGSNFQKSYLNKEIQQENENLVNLIYYDNSNLVLPFSMVFFNKLDMKYDKFTIKHSYSELNEINIGKINYVLTENGNVYSISNLNASNPDYFFTDKGERINEKIVMYFELEKIPDNSIELEKVSPVEYVMDAQEKFFNKKNNGEVENKTFRLRKEDNSGLFTTLSFDENTENFSIIDSSDSQLFKNDIFSYKNSYTDLNFSFTGVDFNSEEKIENDINQDLFKVYPTDRYSFLISANKFIMLLPEEYLKNNFNRSLVENYFSINIFPIEKVNLSNILNPNLSQYEYFEPNLAFDFAKKINDNLQYLNNNDYLKNNHSELLNIKARTPVFIYPSLRTKLELKEKIALKDKFDITIAVDFREDYSKDYLENEITIPSSQIKEINNQYYYNGVPVEKDGSSYIYKYKSYLPPTKSSNKKELVGKSLMDGDQLYKLYEETENNLTAEGYFDKFHLISPIVFLDELKILRKKQNTEEKEILLTIYMNDFGIDILGNLTENKIYMRNSSGEIRNENEIIDSINEISYFNNNFDSILIERISYSENNDYIYSFKIKGIKMISDLFGDNIEIYGKSKLILNDFSLKNKNYEIISENKKEADIIIRKLKAR